VLKRPVSDSDSHSVSHSVCCLPSRSATRQLSRSEIMGPLCTGQQSRLCLPPSTHTATSAPAPFASLVSSCTRHFVLVKTRQGISHGWANRIGWFAERGGQKGGQRTSPGQKACQWSNCYLPAEGQGTGGSNSFQLQFHRQVLSFRIANN